MPRDHRPGKSIRVLLAEDQGMMRGALALLLGLEPDIEVVAQVGAGDAIVDAALTHRPDVALLDIELPGRSGLDAAADLRDQAPDCRVLILTTFGRPGYLRRAMEAGAAGFLVKDGPVEELAVAIRRVLTGETVIDPALAAAALSAGPQRLGCVGQASLQPAGAVQLVVGQLRAHRAGRETGQDEGTAGRQDPVEEAEVADAPVRGQVVEAAGVHDQVVRSRQFGGGEGEGVTAEPADLAARLPRPPHGLRGQVDRVHREAPRRQVAGVAAVPAAEVEGAARADESAVEGGDQVLVRLVHEERHRAGTVGVEAVPPWGALLGPAVGVRREQSVQQAEHVVHVAYVPVHPGLLLLLSRDPPPLRHLLYFVTATDLKDVPSGARHTNQASGEVAGVRIVWSSELMSVLVAR
jgi:two-component system response regulator DesR